MALRSIVDIPAPAKLNLDLRIVGRRADGYHLLVSHMVPIDWCDTLHVERRDDGTLARHDLGDPLPADDLCLRAARALRRAAGRDAIGADISIEKRVPSGAGLGGGSSDAATVLLALNRLWSLDLPLERLLEIGLSLGADVPFFLAGGPARVTGIGDRFEPFDQAPSTFCVVKPERGLETRAIFASPTLAALVAERETVASAPTAPARIAGFSEGGAQARSEENSDLDPSWRAGGNDLQAPAEELCPDVTRALALLLTAFGNSRMTGSGSAVFARVPEASGGAAAMPLLPTGWQGRICRSLAAHPLSGWARQEFQGSPPQGDGPV